MARNPLIDEYLLRKKPGLLGNQFDFSAKGLGDFGEDAPPGLLGSQFNKSPEGLLSNDDEVAATLGLTTPSPRGLDDNGQRAPSPASAGYVQEKKPGLLGGKFNMSPEGLGPGDAEIAAALGRPAPGALAAAPTGMPSYGGGMPAFARGGDDPEVIRSFMASLKPSESEPVGRPQENEEYAAFPKSQPLRNLSAPPMVQAPPMAQAPDEEDGLQAQLARFDSLQGQQRDEDARSGFLSGMSKVGAAIAGQNNAIDFKGRNILGSEKERQALIKQYLADKYAKQKDAMEGARLAKKDVRDEERLDTESAYRNALIKQAEANAVRALREPAEKPPGMTNEEWDRREAAKLAADKEMEEFRQKFKKGKGDGGKKDEARSFKASMDLRKEYDSLPGVKALNELEPSIAKMENAVTKPSAAGDLALIFSYMKMLDPGSSVKEGEFANAENAKGVPATILGKYNKVISGERLNQGQRNEFYGQAKVFLGAHQAQVKKYRDRYRSMATKAGLDPDDVTGSDPDAKGGGRQGVSSFNLDDEAPGPASAPQASAPARPEDSKAVTWARANPNDPRAAAILKANGG